MDRYHSWQDLRPNAGKPAAPRPSGPGSERPARRPALVELGLLRGGTEARAAPQLSALRAPAASMDARRVPVRLDGRRRGMGAVGVGHGRTPSNSAAECPYQLVAVLGGAR